MYVVVIARITKKISEVLKNEPDIYQIKLDGPRLFLYVDKEMDLNGVAKYVKQAIYKYINPVFVFSVYGLYNGKVDFFEYLSEDAKKSNLYYDSTADLSEEDMNAFFEKYPQLKK